MTTCDTRRTTRLRWLWAILVEECHIGSVLIHEIDWRSRTGTTSIVLGEQEVWGEGYAMEATGLRSAYAFEALGLETLTTEGFAPNAGSRRGTVRQGCCGGMCTWKGRSTTCGWVSCNARSGRLRRTFAEGRQQAGGPDRRASGWARTPCVEGKVKRTVEQGKDKDVMAMRGILLDVDGMLVLSNDAQARDWVKAFKAHGHDVPFETVRPLIGMGGDKVVPEHAPGLSSEDGEGKEIADTRKELTMDTFGPTLTPAPGARAFAESAQQEGLTIVVASSSTAVELEMLLAVAWIDDLL